MPVVSLLYNAPGSDAGMDDLDTLEQVKSIETALRELGVETSEIPVPEDFNLFRKSLRKDWDALVFNLTDPLAGEGRFISLYPLALEQEGRRYTGSSADALYTTSNKILAKKIMNLSGIPTAYFVESAAEDALGVKNFKPGRYIIKSIWEHSSQGMGSDSVFEAEEYDQIKERLKRSPGGFFAESFLPGREINIALLQDDKGWTLLSPSEIVYSNASDPAPFLDYESKWDENSSAYKDSSRSLDFSTRDTPLLDELNRIALKCADVFSLGGYARVDFRLDAEGNPMVMEVNANPCITPNSGFVSAAQRSGIGFTEIVRRILSAALADA
jgi:D-alanine-D-alanine ligase